MVYRLKSAGRLIAGKLRSASLEENLEVPPDEFSKIPAKWPIFDGVSPDFGPGTFFRSCMDKILKNHYSPLELPIIHRNENKAGIIKVHRQKSRNLSISNSQHTTEQ